VKPRHLHPFALSLLALASTDAYPSTDPHVDLTVCETAGSQELPMLAATSDGGCSIGWFDTRAGFAVNPHAYNRFDANGVYAQEINPAKGPGITTDVAMHAEQSPTDFSPEYVALKVYDILGREVAARIEQPLLPGVCKERFHAENVLSGVYLNQLRTARSSPTRARVVIR